MRETSDAVILVQNISKKPNEADAGVGDYKQAVPIIHLLPSRIPISMHLEMKQSFGAQCDH